MTIEAGPIEFEDCARSNGFELNLSALAFPKPFICGIGTRDPENCPRWAAE
jgi:hypothetical protein